MINILPTSRLVVSLLMALPLLVVPHPLTAQNQAVPLSPMDAQAEPVWAFEESDIAVDPDFVFGQLNNGMRYIVRHNATPEGTALVRMRIDSGSLDETDTERGLSHFLEHMAFNGSTNIPEGEMIPLLEREGLAFGADTNASTGFQSITYMLNLPRNDEMLLDTALMLMRETASELTIAEDAVERERGVILAERRDRRGFRQRAQEDSLAFLAPDARFVDRIPIGTLEVLENATAAQLRALYERTYTPANTVLVVVGDFPVAIMEEAIRARFSDWQPADAPRDPTTGPVDLDRSPETRIYLDTALPEQVSLIGFGSWRDEKDTIANREIRRLRSIGYAIINRRLSRLAREEDAPFSRANFSTVSLFEDARTTSLTISTVDGAWRNGMLAAVREVNEALTFGFTEAEVAEQVARQRANLENARAADATRSNNSLVSAALRLVSADAIPTTPDSRLERFEAMEEQITAQSVFAAMNEHAVSIGDPFIRFAGRTAPEGGNEALSSAFAEGMALPISPPEENASAAFAYTDFGPAGNIISDTREERLGFRYITFANGVRLTLKATDIREDRIGFRMSLDGGSLLNTRDDPLKTYLVGSLPSGGLGAHSADELQSILAGRNVSLRVSNSSDTFSFAGGTTPGDLSLQMQVLAAALTDPGYRPEAVSQFRRGIDNFYEALNATPGRAYSNAAGSILSDDDPRFSLQPREAFYALDYDRLETAIAGRWLFGAIELALVGDLDEEQTIAAVAATLGALPNREEDFLIREDARNRSFTAQRGTHIVRHDGEPDQALVRLVWPTTDDSDQQELIRTNLLARVVQIELTERLREELGQAYSPSASSNMSRIYRDYGTFVVTASVDVSEVEPTRAAITALIAELRERPVDPDLLDRARQPLLESYDNALKSLGGWLGLADRAQSQPDRLERWFTAPDLLRTVTPEDLQTAATIYLTQDDAVEFLVLPNLANDTLVEAE